MPGRRLMSWYIVIVPLYSILNHGDAMSPVIQRGQGKSDEVEKLAKAFYDIDEKNEKASQSDSQRFEDLLRKLKEAAIIAEDEGTSSDLLAAVQSKSKPVRIQAVPSKGNLQSSTSGDDELGIQKEKVNPINDEVEDENNEQYTETPFTTSIPTTQSPPKQPSPAIRLDNHISREPNIVIPVVDKTTQVNTPESAEVISPEELKSFFINSGRGSSVMIPGCNLVHFHIKSRCSGNLLELTLLSRSPLRGQVKLLEGDGEVSMDGTNLVAYGVLGHLSSTGNMWKLTKNVLKKDLQRNCYICDSMTTRVVIEAEDATCGMVINCQQKGSSRIVNVEENRVKPEVLNRPAPQPAVVPTSHYPPPPNSGPNAPSGSDSPVQDPGNTAKTTMTLVYSPNNANIEEMAGVAVTNRVSIGTRMNLVLSVFSKDVSLDLHVVRCQAKGDDGRGVFIVKDGCSVSGVIGEFREKLSIVQETSFGNYTVRRVSQHAEVRAFNFRRSPQNITLICTIKMCGGECTERPTCVESEINLSRSTRPPIPIFTQEVTLGKVFHVGGFPLDPSPDIANLMIDTDSNKPDPLPGKCPDGCIAFRTVVIMLGVLTGFCFIIILMAIHYVRRSVTIGMKSYHMDDFESPPRSYYPEYSSPRKRTPQTSPEHTSFSISSEEMGTPIYGRKGQE